MGNKKTFLIFICCIYLFVNVSSVMAYELLAGKIVANLDTTSNKKYVEWYVKFAPNIAATIGDNTLYLAMNYQLRDDSKVRGENQAAEWTAFSWDPITFSWLNDAGGGVYRDSNRIAKYNWTDKISKPMAAWSSSSNAVKFKIVATAKSGESTTDTKYIWVVRNSSVGASNTALFRWMCSRYDRSAMYKEMANAWRSMQDNPRGEGFMNAMNHLIDISKGFVTTNAADLGFDLGTESLNLLARGTALASSMGEVNNVLYQAITWVSTANNLLGQGTKDAIATAVDVPMTKQAVGKYSGLSTRLEGVANDVRSDADTMKAVLYSGTSSIVWKEKMKQERDTINQVLNDINSGRSAIATWLSSYTKFSNLGFGVGSGTYNAAQEVANKLYDFLNGVENQLKVDKNLLDKMII